MNTILRRRSSAPADDGVVADLFDVANELAEQFEGSADGWGSRSSQPRRHATSSGTSSPRSRCLVRARGHRRSRSPTAWRARRRSTAWAAVVTCHPLQLPGRIRAGVRILFSDGIHQAPDPYVDGRTVDLLRLPRTVHRQPRSSRSSPTSTEPVFGWRFFEGNFDLGYSIVLDVLGLGAVGRFRADDGRRGISRPRRLDYALTGSGGGDPQRGACTAWLLDLREHPGWSSRSPVTRRGLHRHGPAGRPQRSSRPRVGSPPRASTRSARRLCCPPCGTHCGGHTRSPALAFVAQHPLEVYHILQELRLARAARPARRASGCADPQERASVACSGSWVTRRLQPGAPPPARRLHEMRQVP